MKSKTQIVLSMSLLLAACVDDGGIAVGTLERDRIELIASVSEVITEIHVREGDVVARGDLLMQQDVRISAAELAALTATSAQAAARVAELERGPRFEKIAEARAVVAGNKSLEVEAAQNFKRVKSLFERKLASQAELDTVAAKHHSSVAAVNAAKEHLNAMENGTTNEELQQAHYALAAARAHVNRSQLLHDKLFIKAPRNGVIDDIVFELGEQPAVGNVLLVMLAEGAPYARVYIPQTFRAGITPGSKLQVHIDGIDSPVSGIVRKISSDPAFTPYYALTERDRSRLAYLAEIELAGERVKTLPAGLPVQVELEP